MSEEKARHYQFCGYLTVADLTEGEKKKIWDYIYENSSPKAGEHNLDFTIREYLHCMRHEGAINDMLMFIEDEKSGPDCNDPNLVWTIITYAE